MDPNNPLRGPRRALRRGERALRYDRMSYPEAADVAEVAEVAEAGRGRQDEGGPFRNDRLVMQRMREEIWANDDTDDEDGNVQADTDDDDDDDLARGVRHVARDDRRYFPSPVNDSMMAGVRQRGGRMMEIRDGDLVEADSDEEDEGEQEGDGEGMEDGVEDGLEGMEGEEVEEGDEGEEGEGEEFFDFPGDLPDGDEASLPAFDPVALGLKEINNLAHFSVSSHKPGNGVEELLSDDLDKFWQSDGPQPHLLTIHFLRRVEIRAIRLFVDYNQDESYTPTAVSLSAGTGHHDLLEFSALALNRPVGWQEINLSEAGGGADGNSLCCWIVQVRVRENHQNGKDTHVRAIKLYGTDENAVPAAAAAGAGADVDELTRLKMQALQQHQQQQQQQQAMGGMGGLRGVSPMLDPDDYMLEQLLMQSPERMGGHSDRTGAKSSIFRELEIR